MKISQYNIKTSKLWLKKKKSQSMNFIARFVKALLRKAQSIVGRATNVPANLTIIAFG